MNTEKALIFAVAGFILWKAANSFLKPTKAVASTVTADASGGSMGATQ